MSKYNLNNFGAQKFELLSQNLVQQIIGYGAKVYGMGKDGAREATFKGKANYPSDKENWDGDWIFQAKFHDIQQIGVKEARSLIFRELDDELKIITEKYKHPCNNYILITNVPLSPVYKTGLKDRIDNLIIPKYKKHVQNIHVWGAEEICSFLDIFQDIRHRYSDLLVSGDIISKLMGIVMGEKDDLDEKVKLYCQGSYMYESAASLDDAGDVDDQNIDLQKIFIDLNVKLSTRVDYEVDSIPEWMKRAYKEEEKNTALSYILDDSIKRLAFVGGPGLGKSTLGQYISQAYRARLIGKLKEFEPNNPSLESIIPRIPFRIILKDFAWWLSEQQEESHCNIFHFLSSDLSTVSGREISVEDIHKIIKDNPIMLILDGLDEVPEKELRKKVLNQINIFINQIGDVYNSDYRIIASTRPQGYTEEFDPTQYLHLNLQELDESLALHYANRWVNEKEKNPKEIAKIMNTLKICLKDKIVRDLTKTPLQITILLVIIRAGSTPPKQREELYQTYMDTLYRREQKKNLNLISTEKSVIYGLHQYLGYLLHKRAEKSKTHALMNIQEFKDHVLDYLIYLNPILDEEELITKTQQIITETRNRLILIDSPQEDKVGFTLTVMREFFAACHLVETSKNSEERNKRFKAITKSPYWRNVALFFVGRVGRTMAGEASNLIDICREVDTEDENQYLKRGSQLSLEIVKDKALRVPYNELSALEYSLNIFESDLFFHFEDIISVLKEKIVNPSFSKTIEKWLLDKINSVKLEKVKKYLRVYYEVFGLKDKIVDEIKKVNLSSKLKIDTWELKLILNNQIYEEWVVPIVERFLENSKDFFLIAEEDCNWENLIHLYRLKINNKAKSRLSEFLCDFLSELDFHDEDDLAFYKKITENILGENKELKDKEYLLPWGICFAFSSSLTHHVEDEHLIKLPNISYPAWMENINKENKLLSQFISIYKENDLKICVYLTQLFEFYLNPNNLEILSRLINSKSNFIKEITIPIFGEIKKENINVVSNLTELYQSDMDVKNDIIKLNSIIANTQDDYFKYKLWIRQNGNPLMEQYLDSQVVSEIKNWIQERELVYGVIEMEEWHGGIKIKDMVLMELTLLKDRIYNNVESGFTTRFIALYLSKALDTNNPVDEDIDDLKDELLAILQYLLEKRIEDSMTLEILWLLLGIGEVNEEHLKLIYAKIDINDMKFTHFHHFNLSDAVLNNLISFLNSPDKQVSFIAGILLSISSNKNRRLYHYKSNFKIDESSFNKYWSLILENKSVIQQKLLEGLILFQLDWEKVKKHFLDDIFSSDKKNQEIWGKIIRFSGYCNDSSRETFLELITYILENKMEQKELYRAAIVRLERETINSEFHEQSLNLPLPKRRNFSF